MKTVTIEVKHANTQSVAMGSLLNFFKRIRNKRLSRYDWNNPTIPPGAIQTRLLMWPADALPNPLRWCDISAIPVPKK